jgi:hypothetical protein
MAKLIEKIILNSNQNTNDLDSVQKITIKIDTDNFMKKIIEIPILLNQPISNIE